MPGAAVHHATTNVVLVVGVDPGPVATTESHRIFAGRADGSGPDFDPHRPTRSDSGRAIG
ncbi:TPA: hypothetical protein EYN09_04595 [Candidatus Poribacteria bacterium]|nr:hypothetical protein [Candidatus Poribacteria bacterium]